MISPQQLGFKFEDNAHEIFKRDLRIKNILREKDVKSAYGENNSSIDILLESDNYVVCIQCKWESKPACISKVNHFLMALNNISKIHVDKKCIGIYLSQLPVSAPSSKAITINDIKCINIHNDDMDLVIEESLIYIHQYEMYTYENDQSIIMR